MRFLSAAEQRQAVMSYNYFLLAIAARHGALDIVEYYESYLSAKERQEAVKCQDYFVFCLAAESGSMAVVQHFQPYLNNKEKKEAIKRLEKDYKRDYFRWFSAAQLGLFSPKSPRVRIQDNIIGRIPYGKP